MEKIKRLARSQIDKIDNTNLLLMGTMLYWAEGAKQKEWNTSQRIEFSNSDPLMHKLFLKWAKVCLRVTEDRIVPRIYIQETQRARSETALNFWSQQTGILRQNFQKTCFTNTKLSEKNRRKDSGRYYGQLKVSISKSTDLNRKIAGWIEGVCLQSRVMELNKL